MYWFYKEQVFIFNFYASHFVFEPKYSLQPSILGVISNKQIHLIWELKIRKITYIFLKIDKNLLK